jgi:glycosyltransferase involved in cell wall biosynthesis
MAEGAVMHEATVTFVTPTYRRDAAVLRRTIHSVLAQTMPSWRLLLISDGKEEKTPLELVRSTADLRIEYMVCTPKGEGERASGNNVRQFGLERVESRYVAFLDDDNIIFPDYVEVLSGALDRTPQVAMAIARIIHLGPLPARLHPPPKVLDGNPPVLHNIDTLQAMFRTPAMQKHGWLMRGYLADGFTFESMAATYGYILVNAVVGVHMCDLH